MFKIKFPSVPFKRNFSQQSFDKNLQKVLETKDVVLYEYDTRTKNSVLRIGSILQLLFWINFGHLAYTKLGKVDQQGNYKLYESWKRSLAGLTCIVLGTSITYGMWLYSLRLVTKVSLVKGGQRIKLVQDRWPKQAKVLWFPTYQTATRTPLGKGVGNRIYLHNSQTFQPIAILDLKLGKFYNQALFDKLFYKPGLFIKPK